MKKSKLLHTTQTELLILRLYNFTFDGKTLILNASKVGIGGTDMAEIKEQTVAEEVQEIKEEQVAQEVEEKQVAEEVEEEQEVEEVIEEQAVEETIEEQEVEAVQEEASQEEDEFQQSGDTQFESKVGKKAKEMGVATVAACKNAAKAVWEYDKKVGKKMLDILISPASEIARSGKELSVSFTIGAVFILFIFITHLINPVFVGYEWELSLKLGIAFWLALIPVATMLVASAIVYLFSKKDGERTAFEDILASFCVATAPSTIFYVIGYFLSFKWSIAMVVCAFFAFVSWVLLSTEVCSSVLKERNLTYWVMFLITILTVIIVGICGAEVVKDIVTGVLLVLNEYIQEVTLEFKSLIFDMIDGAFFCEIN